MSKATVAALRLIGKELSVFQNRIDMDIEDFHTNSRKAGLEALALQNALLPLTRSAYPSTVKADVKRAYDELVGLKYALDKGDTGRAEYILKNVQDQLTIAQRHLGLAIMDASLPR